MTFVKITLYLYALEYGQRFQKVIRA